jgi:proteasome inhibitor subunit 1 (PI31)
MSLEILYNYELSHIRKKQDAVVCFVHSWMLTKDFKCIGKGEEIPKENIRKSDMLPPGWSADDIYSLIYQRQTTGDIYLLKIVNFDNTLLLHLMRIKDSKVSSTEVHPSDYVTNNLSSYDAAFHKQSLDSFGKRLTGELLGLFEEKPKSVPREKARDADRNQPDPLRVPYCRPDWQQPANPMSIGRSDLDPLAGGMGSGMIFDPMRTGFPSYGGPGRGTGGPNILPRGAVPPGARFDPFGPPAPDPSGGMNPDFRNQRSGPDPDHLPRPGYDDMFM